MGGAGRQGECEDRREGAGLGALPATAGGSGGRREVLNVARDRGLLPHELQAWWRERSTSATLVLLMPPPPPGASSTSLDAQAAPGARAMASSCGAQGGEGSRFAVENTTRTRQFTELIRTR
jgi:hypothetical protein